MSVARPLLEIRATCLKAARGAGCPWGMAEEAGMAARVLQSHGLPGVKTLARMFETPRNCPCTVNTTAPLCGLATMAELCDEPPQTTVEIGPIVAPLLLLVPLIEAAKDGQCWQLDHGSGVVIAGPDGIRISGEPAPDIANAVKLSPIEPATDLTPPTWHSRVVEDAAWSALDRLAARTYVPETDASRTAGAGPDESNED